MTQTLRNILGFVGVSVIPLWLFLPTLVTVNTELISPDANALFAASITLFFLAVAER